jgi:hypothetical protein
MSTAHEPWLPPEPPKRRFREARGRIASKAGQFSTAAARAAHARVVDIWSRLPPDAGREMRASLMRLRKAHTPRQAFAALEYEIEHLVHNVAPTLVEHPLPVRTPAAARTIVSVVASAAAAVEEAEAIALLLPHTTAVAAPTLPMVAAASFSALAMEAYIAASLRVHMLQAAGQPVDPHQVTRDTLRAMTGREDVRLTKLAAKALTRRMFRRWSRGVVPFIGMGYATWDAQKTMSAIIRMPLAERPALGTGS